MKETGLFSSEIVRREIENAHQLYREIYMELPTITSASKEDKLKIISKMNRLIDIQEIIYTRIHLTEGDDDADILKENFRKAAKEIGLPPVEINGTIFKKAREAIEHMKNSPELGLLDND